MILALLLIAARGIAMTLFCHLGLMIRLSGLRHPRTRQPRRKKHRDCDYKGKELLHDHNALYAPFDGHVQPNAWRCKPYQEVRAFHDYLLVGKLDAMARADP